MKVYDLSDYKKGIVWLIDCVKDINEANQFKPGYFPSISQSPAFLDLINEYNVEEQYNENIGYTHYNITYLLSEYYVSQIDKEILLPFLHQYLPASEKYNGSTEAFYNSYIESEASQKGLLLAFLLILNDVYETNIYLKENRTINGMSFTKFMENNFNISL